MLGVVRVSFELLIAILILSRVYRQNLHFTQITDVHTLSLATYIISNVMDDYFKNNIRTYSSLNLKDVKNTEVQQKSIAPV